MTMTRDQAVDRAMRQLWLEKEMQRALLSWLGYSPTDPYSARIMRAIGATAYTARRYKTERRHTAFGRKVRLRDRLSAGPYKYKRTSVINAATLELVANNDTFITITEQISPVTNRRNDRRVDMCTARQFVEVLRNKISHELIASDTPMYLPVFAKLGLNPDQLVQADAAYRRLISELLQLNYRSLIPSRGYAGDYRRLKTLTAAGFCQVMWEIPNDAELLIADRTLLRSLAKRLQPRLY